MTNQKTLSPAEIRCLIDEEITGGNALKDSNKAIYELGNLIATSETLDTLSVAHMLSLLHDNFSNRLNRSVN